jgi:hypothetical protein
MRKTNKPIEGYEEGCGEAEEELGESQKSCTVLASEFGDFSRECGAQIWAMKSQVETTLTTEQSTGITCPEDLICWDVLNICSAIANASEPSDEVTAILGAILAKVNPNKFKAEAMSDPAIEGVLSRFLAEWVGQGVSTPIVVNIMVVHDRIHGGQGARRAASVYSLLVLQLFSSYMPSLLDRPSVATAAGQVANEYLKLLKVYIERSKTGDHSTQSDTENACEHSNISRDTCSECSDAYDLLELPFGASKEDVSDAKRELAKTLHPDVWLDRRGSRFAEERLKHVNAACDHLLECHFSGEQGYGIQEDSIRATSHTTTADTSVETRGTTEYVPEMGEPLSGSTFWLWRSIRVFLRAVWRFTKIVLAILLGVVAAAIVLLTIFMALWEHWERESKGQRGQSDLGSMNTKLFSFLESVTWLPRQIWGGLMLVATILFFGLVFAGQAIMEFASSNRIACVLLVCLFGLGLMAWVFHKEWQAEIAATETGEVQPITPWAMGLAVIIVAIAACIWLQVRNADTTMVQGDIQANQMAEPSVKSESLPTSSESDDNLDMPPIPVSQGGSWVLIDRIGKVVATLPAGVEYLESFSDGVAAFAIEERDPNPEIAEDDYSKYQEKWGYIDETGKTVLAAQFTSAGLFREGFALVGMNESSAYYHGVSEVTGTRNYVDKHGHMLLSQPGEAFEAEDNGFSNGLAPMRFEAGWGYIDTNGRLAIPANFVLAEPFSEELAAVATRLVPGGRSGFATKWGYIFPSGVFAIPPVFDSAGRFSEGLAEASKDGTTGFIDRTGSFVIRFPDAMEGEESEFSDNLAVVRIGSKCGAIDRAGNVVISPTYGSLGLLRWASPSHCQQRVPLER